MKHLQAVYHFDNECREEPPLRVSLLESSYLASRGITRDKKHCRYVLYSQTPRVDAEYISVGKFEHGIFSSKTPAFVLRSAALVLIAYSAQDS
jgi:hypothetical protein